MRDPDQQVVAEAFERERERERGKEGGTLGPHAGVSKEPL